MADFLPIKLGKNANGAVTHLQEISLSDKIPESYLQVSSNTVAKWNASSIQGVLVSSLSPEQGYTLVYSSSVSAWVPSTISVDAQTVSLTLIGNSGNTGAILDPSAQKVRQIFVSNDGVLLSVSSTSAMPDGTFYVTSAGSVVPVYLPSYLLRYFGSNGASSYPTQLSKGGLELAPDFYENPIVYVDTNNDRWTWTNQLLVRDTGVLATNVSATNVSATNYLNIGNTTAKWNASAIQGSPVSASLNPSTNQLLIYNGSVWTASTITTVTDHGALTGLADDDHPQYVLSATNNALSSTVSNHIASASVHFTQAQIDHGTIAGLTDNDHPQYVLSSTNSALSSLVDNHIASASVHFTQAQIDHGVILGLADNDHPQYVLSATNSALSSLVSNHIASASVHFTQAEIDHGVILGLGDNDHPQYVLSATNSALSSTVSNHIASAVHWDLATLNANYINASGDSANAAFYFQTVSATTVSATNYLNLPSSPVTIPDPLTVSTLYAGLVSATEYRNVRPYVSAVDSATTTTVNINGGYDTFLVNTTTTSVTLYLPDASAYPDRKITVSKIDDGGSYRSVTLSGAQLQTATNTVLLYDPTESVTVISNGNNWYSMNYDRAYGVVIVCKNSTGATLAKGTPVKVTGATGANVLIGPVSAANDHVPEAPNGDLSRCIGIVEHAIPNGEFGHVLTKGTLYKFNTNAYNEGDILYLAPSGGFTNVKPAAPYDEVFLGIVTRKQSVNGSILIDVTNPIHINDIVGMDLTSSLVNGDLISYSTATSTFTNVQAVNVSGQGKFGSVSATNYFNLPSSTIVWASANYATLAGSSTSALISTNATSATSALNTQQAPNNFSVTGNVSATSTVQAATLSATSYLNLPSSTIVWASAGYATLAGSSTSALIATNATSATSALNAQQAPAGFTVTGTINAGTVSATTYLNLPSGVAIWNANKLQGYDISAVAPSNDQVLKYNSTLNAWVPGTDNTGGGGGGISDASSLRGSPLSATLVPTAGQALMYNGSVWTASAALFAYTYGSGAPTGGSDGDIYLQTDVVALQVPSVSATNLSAINATITAITATSGDLSTTKLTDYSESKSSPTISASALTLNLNNSQVFTVALNSNISTLTISNVEARANTAQGFTLILTADGTARTISWPGSVKWPSGTGPTLTSTNNKVDILSFLSPDNGTTWYGFTGGQNF